MTRVRQFSVAAIVLLLSSGTASATEIFDPTVARCAARNCSAVEFGGTINGFRQSVVPWVVQLYAGAGECLRVEVTTQEADLEMRLVSPDGSETWLNDDSALAPCPLCPLVTLRTRHDGWYTVHLGEFGGASVQASFTLAYGRYLPAANANCPPPALGRGAAVKGRPSPAPDPQAVPGR